MSLFGPVDDTDLRIWQQRNLKGLTELVKLGVTTELPPLLWTLPNIGDVCGRVSALERQGHDPRAVFEAWREALTGYPLVEPRGSGPRGEGEPRSERTSPGGQTRLWAGFTLRLADSPTAFRCGITLIAEWFAEGLVSTDA